MTVDVDLVLDVLERAAKCRSGMIEFFVPSIEQDAVQMAQQAGYMNMVGNGVAIITQAGRDFLAS